MDNKKFFELCRTGIMGPTLDEGEVEGTNTILEAMAGTPVSYCAYALATAFHETAHTMKPIKEIGGPKYFFRMYDIQGQRPSVAKRLGNTKPGDGAKYPGMGFVQCTGRGNAEKVQKELGVPCVENPELLMKSEVAAKVMKLGMDEGWFTGKSFKSYLPNGKATKDQFTSARRIINGTDKASLIAGYAITFQDYLVKSGW